MITSISMYKDSIITEIKNYVGERSRIQKTKYREPLIAFASVDAPLFNRLGDIGAKSHCHPKSLLQNARTVISYFIPFTESVIESNNVDGLSSLEWVIAYAETNKLILDLGHHLKTIIGKEGFETYVPKPTNNFDKSTLESQWSHKHVACIAGLGTFGMHSMIITERGCAGRLGSVITELYVEYIPASHSQSEIPEREFCPCNDKGETPPCVEKCSFGALTGDGLDKFLCYEQCLKNSEYFKDFPLADVCGKCASGVPCSFEIPK